MRDVRAFDVLYGRTESGLIVPRHLVEPVPQPLPVPDVRFVSNLPPKHNRRKARRDLRRRRQ